MSTSMLLILLVCAGGTLGSILPAADKAVFDLNDAHEHFEAFIQTYNRQYLNEDEKQTRFEIFQQNLKEINKQNIDPDQHATFGITKFSDMTKEEFLTLFAGYVPALSEGGTEIEADLKKELPDTFDWRKKNVVTRVKDQKKCSSCWAFSAVGTLESQNAILNNKSLEFSEQQLVDCDKMSSGCKGGDTVSAYIYMVKSGGMETENDYPYKGHDGKCLDDQGKTKLHVTGYIIIPETGMYEKNLMGVMTDYGPLAMALDSSALQSYKSGVITKCPEKVDHAVVFIGYGIENDIPYYTMKNSFGEDWGEHGYFRVKRGACGMMQQLATAALLKL